MEIKSVELYKKIIDYLGKRNELINNNIANSTTPNFKRTDISFKQELDKNLDIPLNQMERGDVISIKTTHEKHISGNEDKTNKDFKMSVENNTIMNNNGNNVDLEKEILESMKVSTEYGFVTRKISGTFSKIKTLFKDLP